MNSDLLVIFRRTFASTASSKARGSVKLIDRVFSPG